MDLRLGYRQTEVGVIPNDWNLTPFAKLFAFRNGVNADKRFYGRGVRFINVLEPITYSHIHGPEITGRVTLPESVTAAYAIVQGDVLFNRTSETQEEVGLAATYVGSEIVVFGGFVIRGRPSEGTLDPVYSGYALRAPWIRSQIIPMGQGAIRANISQFNLSLVVVPLPPLHEQRAIAAALSDVDALLDGLTRLINKKRNLRQAAAQQLLTSRSRLSGFQGDWKQGKLVTVIDGLDSGVSVNSVEDDDAGGHEGPRVLKTSAVFAGEFFPFQSKRIAVRDLSRAWLTPRRGTIIISRMNTPDLVGECGYVDRDFPTLFVPDRLWMTRFKTDSDIDAHWLSYLLSTTTLKSAIRSAATGTSGSMKNLSKQEFLQISIAWPSAAEQTAIAAVLSDMDAELSALVARRDKTRALKQAMMQELLTGRTRLVIPTFTESPKDSERTDGRRANIYFMRSVLAAEIIDRLHEEPTFGHVKFEKMIFLVEHLCDVDTGSSYHRDAAGPYDNSAIRSIDIQLRRQKWFDAQKIEGRYRYEPMANHGKHKEYFERYFGRIGAAFDIVIDTFRGLKTEKCEIVATLFAAWNDLIKQKRPISDDAIVNEVLNNWHESKKRIPEDRWRKALSWMRDKSFVPHQATGDRS